MGNSIFKIKKYRGQKEEYEKDTKNCALLPQPDGMTNPPDFDKLPDTEETKDEYLKLEQAIKADQERLA